MAAAPTKWRAWFAGMGGGDSPKGGQHDPAGPGHRPQRLRGLPRLRDELQAVEHLRLGRPAGGREPLRQGPDRHLLQPRAELRGGRVPQHADGALPQELPALRGPALRAGVPHRRQLQARQRRHRAGRLRQVHRLQLLRLGLSLRRARTRREAPGDDQVHAVRRPHRRQDAARGRAQARLRDGLPDQRAPVRRRARPRQRGVGGHPRPRRLPADARGRHPARQPLPAARRKTEARIEPRTAGA
jgi:hypothetical protein